jgi:uncharacterized protein YbjT (DUF2867 family)
MNLVVGATGYLGGAIVSTLAAQGRPVRAMVRPTSDPGRVENLKSVGAGLVEGDLKDRSSLDVACQGCTAVITTASTTISRQEGDTLRSVDLEGQKRLVDAARAAGVSRYVYVSIYSSADREYPSPLTEAKRAVEAHLKESGLTYTILRPSFFMEVWLSPILGFDYVNAKARICGSGENPVSWISLGDVAKFAVASLDNPGAENATLELGGPQALSPLEVVGIFKERGGHAFEVEYVPEMALRGQRAGAATDLDKSFAALMLSLAAGDPVVMNGTLQVIPMALTSVQDYADRVYNAA